MKRRLPPLETPEQIAKAGIVIAQAIKRHFSAMEKKLSKIPAAKVSAADRLKASRHFAKVRKQADALEKSSKKLLDVT